MSAMTVVHVDSLDHPDLEPYRTLRGQTQHWSEGHFVAEGEKAVRALMDAPLHIVSMLLSEDWLKAFESEGLHGRLAGVTLYVASDDLLEGIVGFPLHKRLMAIGRIPVNPDLELLHDGAGSSAVHVALEGIADAENMGMILRNCAAFGAANLLVGADSTSPWLRRSVRVSLGNVFSLRIHRSEDILATLRRCRDELGWRVIGTTPRGGATGIAEARDGGGPVCLLFGSEAYGLSEEALSLCDGLFSIPMRNEVDSINVANAVAVTLYEATRT